jgi:serine/threonine protein phosphatase PrpC
MAVTQFKIRACDLSDIGLVRNNNEDLCSQLPEYRFYILADGMGGHQAGEVAAREAVMTLNLLIQKWHEDGDYATDLANSLEFINYAIEQTNRIVYEMGHTDETLKGMGTTLCLLYFLDNKIIYAHVGDSRIYRLRNGVLEQITNDHSLLRELIELGQIREEDSEHFAYKNIITKAIGTERTVEPTVHFAALEPNDLFLMCSDGLSDPVSMKEIENILNKNNDIQRAAKSLISTAKKKGGHDNISVLIAQVYENDDSEKDLSR